MFSVKKFVGSFKYAWQGLVHLFRHEQNAYVHLLALTVVVLAGFYFDIRNYEWVSIFICVGLVFCCELINTAIERIVNFVSPKYHKNAGVIKDLGAAAVLIAALISLIVAAIIFTPYLKNLT
ncbi:MAG: diacylglycerol kinase family protein [Bacteroidetes bacterium]|nr:diacylglycerol kinase family protein [Bacteroidota bacterium]